jgi:hypothetical protein
VGKTGKLMNDASLEAWRETEASDEGDTDQTVHHHQSRDASVHVHPVSKRKTSTDTETKKTSSQLNQSFHQKKLM